MSGKHSQNQRNNPQAKRDDPLLAKSIMEQYKKPLNDIVSAIKEQTTSQEKENKKDRDATESEASHETQTRKIAYKANRIAIWAIVVNTLIFAATLSVFIYNIKGIEAATKAANVADSTLEETRNEFAVANDSYLEVTVTKLDTLKVGGNITFPWSIINLGKYPAKILEGKAYIIDQIGNVDPPYDGFLKMQIGQEKGVNRYVVNGNPIVMHFTFYPIITKPEYDAILQGSIHIVFVGYLKYQNLITGKIRFCEFEIRFENPAGDAYNYIMDDNTDVLPPIPSP